MNTIAEALREVDNPEPVRPVRELAGILERAINTLHDKGHEEEARTLEIEWGACRMMVANTVLVDGSDGPDKTTPRLSGYLQNADGSSYPDPSRLQPEHKIYLSQRADETTNPALRAHYWDVLFETTKSDSGWKSQRPEIARKAVDAYLVSARRFAGTPDMGHAMVDSLDHAAHLALTMSKAPGCDHLLPQVVSQIHDLLKDEASRDLGESKPNHPRGRWVVDLARLLARIRVMRGAATVSDDILRSAEEACEEFAALHAAGSPWDEIEFQRTLYALAEARGDGAAVYRAERERLRAIEKAAEARATGAIADPLAAAGILERAIEGYEKLVSDARVDALERTKLSDQIGKLRRRVRDLYRDGKSRMGVIEVPLEISQAEVDGLIDELLRPDTVHDCLEKIASEGSLLPNVDLAEEQARGILGMPGMLQHIPLTFLSEDIPVAAGHGFALERDRNLLLWIGINSEVILHTLFQRLRDQKGLNSRSLTEYFDQWGLLDEDNREILSAAFEHYMAGDGIGAMHILAPQFEDVFRSVMDKAGAFIIEKQRGGAAWQFEANLAKMLELQEAQVIPRDIREYIRLVLASPCGWNLRNRVAHGLIKPAQCTLPMVETVLHLFLLLSLVRLELAPEPAAETMAATS
ncbi:MAG TPA: DUF4209 domain-containing protein [Armatimonadota bacterium]|nr:DUF4209 domain-containing protein [Armatimonadota bacterium]